MEIVLQPAATVGVCYDRPDGFIAATVNITWFVIISKYSILITWKQK